MNPQQQAAANFVQNSSAGQPQGPTTLEKLLPTAGGVLGGLVGTLADPVTMGMGSVVGSALGSGLGQAAENGFGGTGSVVGAGAEGAVGGILGGLGGKALEAGGGMLAKLGAGQAEKDAIQSGFGKVASTDREALNFGKNLQFAKDNNLPIDPEQWSQLGQKANGTAGDGGAINGLVDEAVNAVNPQLDLGKVTDAYQGSIKSADGVMGDIQGNPLGSRAGSLQYGPTAASTVNHDITQILSPLTKPPTDSGSALLANSQYGPLEGPSASDARDTLQNLGDYLGQARTEAKSASNLGKSMDASIANSKAQAASAAYNSLKEQLYTPEVDKYIAGKTIDSDGTPVGDLLKSTVNNATSTQDALDAMKQFGEMGRLGDIGASKNLNALPGEVKAMDSSSGILGDHPAVQVASAVSDKAGKVLSVLNRLSGVATKAAAAKAAAQEGTDAGGAGLGGILGSSALQLGAHIPSLGATGAPGGVLGTMGQGNAMNPYMTQGAPAGATQGPSMAWAGEFAPAMIPAMQQAQKAQAGQPVLNSLEQAYANAGGAQGTGGGLLSQLSSLIPGTAAHQYNAQMQQAAAALAQATGMPLQSVLAALPSLMANQQGAQNAFGGMQGALGTMQGQPQFAQPSVLAGMPSQ